MSKNILVVPDQHANPDFTNKRADYLAELIKDVRPDVVVNLGDAADMPSLSSYDKGKRSFHGRSYRSDIDSHLEFQSRLWDPVKRQKKKMPYRVVLEGNHEHRVEKALDLSPELTGTIGFKDYAFDDYYDDIVRYDGGTPGVIELGGIAFAHYFVSGISGRPLFGTHQASAMVDKVGMSCVVGHSHTFDFCNKTSITGLVRNGLVAGVYQDYEAPWAGNVNKLWRSGVCLLNNVENGDFDLQWISLDTLKKEYG